MHHITPRTKDLPAQNAELAQVVTPKLNFSVLTAIAVTGWSRNFLYDLIGSGVLETYTVGSRRFMTLEQLSAAVDRVAAGASK